MFEYQEKYSVDVRSSESARIKIKYPDRIPVIVESDKTNKQLLKLPPLSQTKFLVPKDITMSQFVYVLRRRIKLEPHQALFCIVNKNIPASSDTMESIFEKYKNKDGFLYIQYTLENTFG